MKNIPADIVYDRIMDAAKVEQDVDLAAFLGISAQAVGAAKKKKVVPKTWWPIIEGKTGRTREELTRPLEPIEAGVRFSRSATEDQEISISTSEMLIMTAKVLESATVYRSAL
ncbi:MAG: hypothetical protein RBS40_13305, partial [Rhodocyclaceae bacterium]|nr:hypothetical protein [Rhodocyclaceae bacterium]